MKNILPYYNINTSTIGLFPGKNTDYQTTVWEPNKKLFVVDPALKLIKDNLIRNYSSYESRKFTVQQDTGYMRKVPIPICLNSIFMFPTHAVKHFECCWIVEHHVHAIKKGYGKNDCFIIFINGEFININQSSNIVNNQLKKTRNLKAIVKGKDIS
ncbi:competence protein ComK [Oceanobacillus sp. CAU 1775]